MKRTVAIFWVVVVLLTASVYAVEQKMQPAQVNLSFSGTTANCEVYVYADNMKHEISAVVKLYHGNTCLHTWNASDTGTLDFSETWPVNSGYTYKLTADITINGTTYPTISTTGKCG